LEGTGTVGSSSVVTDAGPRFLPVMPFSTRCMRDEIITFPTSTIFDRGAGENER
jgi:hypothetical protein